MIQPIQNRWSSPGGYKEILILAFPLILSTGSWSLQMFFDRMFLTWLSPEAIAAAMPMMGFGLALSISVGQNIGKKNTELAARGAWSTFHMALTYIISICMLYLMTPKIFLLPYAHNSNPKEFGQIANITFMLLRFVAAYSIFDCMSIIFSSAIKGAGDTRFVMWTSVILSWTVMVVPAYLAVYHYHGGLYITWTFATLFIIALGSTFLIRFIKGKWKEMKVIEEKGNHASIPEKSH